MTSGTATPFAPDSSANERPVPASPEELNDTPEGHVRYRRETSKERGSRASYNLVPRPGFKLRPIRGDGYWIVEDTETGIHGDAENVQGALREFYRAANEHLDVLERQSELSDELTHQLKYLQQRIRR